MLPLVISLAFSFIISKLLLQYFGRCRANLQTKFFEANLLGHRGCGKCSGVPENSLKAFDIALNIHKTDGVEFDVQLSKDGVPIVFHDPTLDRLIIEEDVANLPTNVTEDLTWDQLKNLRYKDDPAFTIPSLDETLETVLQAVPDCKMMVESKGFTRSAERAMAIVNAFQKYSLFNQAVTGSFNPIMLHYVKQMAPQVPTLLLVEPDHPTCQYTKKFGKPQGLTRLLLKVLDPIVFWVYCYLLASLIEASVLGNKNDPATNVSFVEKWTKRGYSVNIWTVNSEEHILQIRQAGGTATSDLCQRHNPTPSVVTPSVLPSALSASAL